MLTMYPAEAAKAFLILAHGAGAGQKSPFMVQVARGMAARGITTATFDFPYVVSGRSAPDKAPVLEAAWRVAIDDVRRHAAFSALPLFIGGKSMGGRIASHVAARGVEGVRGLVFLGYPLHPPGRPEQRRDTHLPDIKEPMLFVQGSRDQFGGADDIRAMLPRLNADSEVFEVADGDHSFKVRVKIVNRKQQAVIEEIYDAVAAFIMRWSGRPGAPSA